LTELWLIRHGETDWNLEGRLQGQADPPLNATGWRQAEQLADRLAGQDIEALYSSDLLRARQTAGVIGRRLRLSPCLDRRLREVNHGEWDGMLTADVKARYAARWASRLASPLDVPPPGGETVLQVARRAAAAADSIARAHPQVRVAVVSHGLALAALDCQARGIPLDQALVRIPANAEPDVVCWLAPEQARPA
jgi:probable phosphoglycerate mutase